MVEIASNDGYLLRYFVERGIPVLGVEPAANVAEAARKLGHSDRGALLRQRGGRASSSRAASPADLLLGNNVLAHVPDLNDFVGGLSDPAQGRAASLTMEFPHLVRLIDGNQFDTIYHEHFSYFSFLAVERVFAAHGLELFDVEELPTHGGSLRIFARHTAAADRSRSRRARRRARSRASARAGVETPRLLRRLRRAGARDQARRCSSS